MYLLLFITVIFYDTLSISSQASTSATLRFATPLATSVEVFVTSPCEGVMKWMIQYRRNGDHSTLEFVETSPTRINAVRVGGLRPNTEYQFRARPSQFNETTNVTEASYPYSQWEDDVVKTDFLSIFGRLMLSDTSFSPAHRTEGSSEWNRELKRVQNVYSSGFSIHGNFTSVLRIEASADGKYPVVYYRVRVPDLSLPSAVNYTITGQGISECIINNGDTASGTTWIDVTSRQGDNKYTLWYRDGTCPTRSGTVIVERYMIVSPKNHPTVTIHLNVASSEATVSREEDSLIVRKNGELVLDNGRVYATLPESTVLGLTPKFLIKDCLNRSKSELYSEVFGATVYNTVTTAEHAWDTTNFQPSPVNASSMSCHGRRDETSMACWVPAVMGGYLYQILNTTNEVIFGETRLENISCYSSVQVIVGGLSVNASYEWGIRVWIRLGDGTIQSTTSTDVLRVTNTEAIDEPTSTSPPSTAASDTTTFDSSTHSGDRKCYLPALGCTVSLGLKIGILIAIGIGLVLIVILITYLLTNARNRDKDILPK